MIPSYFRLPHRKWHEDCWWLPSDNLQWLRCPNVSLCEGGEEFRHYILTTEGESGLMCCMLHQSVKILHLHSQIIRVDSRWGLLTREATSTEKPLLQRASRILSMRIARDWTDRGGFDLEAVIVTNSNYVKIEKAKSKNG